MCEGAATICVRTVLSDQTNALFLKLASLQLEHGAHILEELFAWRKWNRLHRIGHQMLSLANLCLQQIQNPPFIHQSRIQSSVDTKAITRKCREVNLRANVNIAHLPCDYSSAIIVLRFHNRKTKVSYGFSIKVCTGFMTLQTCHLKMAYRLTAPDDVLEKGYSWTSFRHRHTRLYCRSMRHHQVLF